mmetsp:Transcript_14055/g.21945  ORF Transcript_14055/g.21945 Transcript_14055/m.21945 type:complete len:312 (+) Transcript_14055:117-1052(+)|eukprot:CAMPEP_0195285056 /NCGR_PEP_ID=MMETSP0707-20130614/3027_1 /TAXON_ID=33640 /ORGANISM="Asterionellopsis glacialis, Strain CCMP134" /LENGTH=311 /DNA_ID=CAMNT_0040344487 /DNA_START=104 /DNA_END=1039 /DNA_ORIENTATION=+
MRLPSFLISSFVIVTTTTAVGSSCHCEALQFPSLPKVFGRGRSSNNKNDESANNNLMNDILLQQQKDAKIEETKTVLLQAVSFTNNGKDADEDKQREVLKIVRSLEVQKPPSPTFLKDIENDDEEGRTLLDGTWYLQYTSPSEIGTGTGSGDDKEDGTTEEDADDSWKAEFAQEGDSNIPTTNFNAKGTVNAAGITVDTSNTIVKQIIDTDASTVTNDVALDFGRVVVGGPYRPSPNVSNRVLVAFQKAAIILNNGFEINFGFVFDIIRFVRNSTDDGWLEITYLDEDIRIGRGNKGTMFVLTRKADAVQP